MEVKKVVSEATHRVYDNFYARLGTEYGEKDIYKLAKLRGKKLEMLARFDIKEMWKGCLDGLLNESHVSDSDLDEPTMGKEWLPQERQGIVAASQHTCMWVF